jgi:hypothetical protein
VPKYGTCGLAAARHLAPAELVHDLAGLFFGEGVLLDALSPREVAERIPGEPRVERKGLEGCDDRVAPEHRRVPRDPGRDDVPAIDIDVEGSEVVGRAAQDHIELGDVRGPAAPVRPPAAVQFLEIRPAPLEPPRRRKGLRGRTLERHVPFQSSRHLVLEYETPAREAGAELGGWLSQPHHGSQQAAVAPAIAERHAIGLGLRRKELPPPIAAPAAHLEDVREVSGADELHPVLERAGQVAGERHALGKPVGEQELAADMDRVLGIPRSAAERKILHREVHLSGVRPRDLGREERRRAAAQPEGVVAQDPRVVVE